MSAAPAFRSRGVVDPVDGLSYAYFVLLSLLTLLFWSRIPGAALLLAANIAYLVIITILILSIPPDAAPFLLFLRRFYPWIVLTLVYRETEFYMRIFHSGWLDGLVTGLERRLFGVAPTLWLEALVSPPLTEFFKFVYFLYMVLVAVIPLSFFLRGERKALQWTLFTMLLAFYLCYLGYMILPVEGPRYFWGYPPEERRFIFPLIRNPEGISYRIPRLEGYLFTPLVDAIMIRGDATGACIPSSHNAASTIILAVIHRYYPRWFPAAIPVVASIFISTIYNRYHYVTDLAAGIAVGMLAVWIGNRVFRAGR